MGAIVLAIGLPQPAVSKHLSVLREVGILSVVKHGQQRIYQLHPQQLKPMYDWLKTYERFWSHQLDRVKQRAERKARERSRLSNQNNQNKGPSSV